MPLSKDRIAVLDGLRGFSIVLVVAGHLAGTRGFPLHENLISAALALLGVRVFFVISGFLITQILLNEVAESGTVNLGRFYFRRTLRIFVPYYAFLFAMFALERAGVILVGPNDFAAAATYTSNYNPHAAWQLAHTWSLSVEEQFYLLWPAALALLGRKRAFGVVALAIIGLPLVRIGMWKFAPALHDGIGHRFETCADSLATGCLLAAVRGWLTNRAWYTRIARSSTAVVVTGMVLASVVLDNHPRMAFLFGWSFQNVGIAFVIDACLRDASGGLGWLLTTAPAVAIGRMSYSIYLWQQLFLDRQSTSLMCRFPFNLVVVAATAVFSYRIVELGSLALRQRWEPRLFRARVMPRPSPSDVAIAQQ
jgi:peptidoglycan/LPS O-acetylase OafA/YrhL